jgi:hypothetical protein
MIVREHQLHRAAVAARVFSYCLEWRQWWAKLTGQHDKRIATVRRFNFSLDANSVVWAGTPLQYVTPNDPELRVMTVGIRPVRSEDGHLIHEGLTTAFRIEELCFHNGGLVFHHKPHDLNA